MSSTALEPKQVSEVQVGLTPHTSIDADLAKDRQVIRANFRFAYQIIRVALVVLVCDLFAVAVSAGISLAVTTLVLGYSIQPSLAFTCVGILVLAEMMGLWLLDLYPPVGIHPATELKHLTKTTLLVGIAITSCIFAFSLSSAAIAFTAICFFCLLFSLPFFRSVSRSLTRRTGISIPFFFLGDREKVLDTFRDMHRFGWPLMKPAGRFEDLTHRKEFRQQVTIDDAFELEFERQAEYLGGPENLATCAQEQNVFWLLRVPSEVESTPRATFPREVLISRTENQASSSSSLVSIGMANGVHTEDSLLVSNQVFAKRLIDVLLSAGACLALAPVFASIAVLIRLTSRGEVMFASPRVGRGGKIFRAWKFRTMVTNADEVLQRYLIENPEIRAEYELDLKLKHDPRITWIGRFLRKTSLDELPQLYNVLLGEMSLVGPRPMLESERRKYGPIYDDYLRVTPGITGLWQVSGRNDTSYADRLKYVRVYVRDWTPWMDFYILLRTIKTVLFCEGAY